MRKPLCLDARRESGTRLPHSLSATPLPKMIHLHSGLALPFAISACQYQSVLYPLPN